MRAALAVGVAVTLVVVLLVLSSTVTSAGTAVPKATAGHRAGHSPDAASREPPGASPLPANPANCTQGTRAIQLSPSAGDMEPTLLNDYTTLGKAGGGTIDLSAGIFYLNETLNMARYSNVSFQGAGMGRTILSVPPDPIGSYVSDNGTPVGLFNSTSGGPVNGTAVNLIQVSGSQAVNNFEMCDLTIDAQANNASEDWTGSLIMDISGGYHHVYSDIAEVGFFGPSTNPNGLHLESSPWPKNPGVDYVIDNLVADNNTVPFETYPGYTDGPNYLNVGAVVNCTLDNITGIGIQAFEVGPPHGCLIENWYVRGHMLIDPLEGGTWGGSLFQNVTVNATGTASPNALDIDVANSTSNGGSNFTELRWNDCQFFGQVLDASNMVDVENSTFSTGLNSTPSVFEHNIVTWDPNASQDPVPFPIRVDGLPAGGGSSVVSSDTFIFPVGTGKYDPFLLTANQVSWSNDTVEIAGTTNGYILKAPHIAIAPYSTFSGIVYDSLGNGSPPDLILFDIVGSPGYQDLGAVVGPLTRVYDDLPTMVPSMPEALSDTARGVHAVALAWDAASGPVTEYTVEVVNLSSSARANDSSGLSTALVVTGLAPATSYLFTVEAWNSSLHSPASTALEVTTLPLPQYAPSIPTQVAVAGLGATQVEVQWEPSTGNVTNYTVYAGTDPTKLAESFSVGSATSYTVGGLASNTTYYFAVEAWNGSFASGPSAPVNATTLAAKVSPKPPAPSHVAPSTISSNGWILVFAVVFGTVAGVVAPPMVIGVVRGRARTGGDVRRRSRRASAVRSGRFRKSSQGSLRGQR